MEGDVNNIKGQTHAFTLALTSGKRKLDDASMLDEASANEGLAVTADALIHPCYTTVMRF